MARATDPTAPQCLDEGFYRWLQDRRLIDVFAGEQYGPHIHSPAPQTAAARRAGNRHGVIRVSTNQLDSALVEAWREIPDRLTPPPGFRVGIMGDGRWKLPADATPLESAAAVLVQERLACDGLLRTAVQALRALGDTRAEMTVMGRLRRVGFPVGLLRYFHPPGPESLIDLIAAGRTNELALARFEYLLTEPAFEPVAENGEADLSLVRAQIGGGFRGGDRAGIVPGSGFDVAGKLVEALPNTRFLISLDEDFVEFVRHEAQIAWPLRRVNQLTLIGEPLPVSGWAQDNGKGGAIRGPSGRAFPAVLAPRFASTGESESFFMPGESFLLAGLVENGVRVVHSALLFQGGNLLILRDPETGQRVLLISESEINRNLALGLNEAQVEQAFKAEFAAARCVVLPLVSYHLDYDVTCRTVDGKLVALVNDPLAIARSVVRVGIQVLAEKNRLPKAAADGLLAALGTSDEARRAQEVDELMSALPGAESFFKAGPADAPAGNLACFRIALDWLACARPDLLPAPRRAYLEAMRRKLDAIQAQNKILAQAGLRTVPVPSMPDLRVGLNYLNGVHDRSRFLMPAYGGFYQQIDEQVARSLAAVFGPGVRVIPIPCAEMQRQHGALHCMVSIFPPDVAVP